MDDLVHQGKILYWGTSEWTGEQLEYVHGLCSQHGYYGPQVEQPEYNLLARERFEQDVREVVQTSGMGVVTWSPLASGLLTGKYAKGLPRGSRLERVEWLRANLYKPENVTKAEQLMSVAKKVDCSPTQLALAWVAAQPAVSSVILGATRMQQIEENLGARQVKIDADSMAELDRVFAY
jgi:aryl-alcohol dehydrogenase-like predicted oxidoreductase